MRRPFAIHTISSNYGSRIVPGTVHTHHHTGQDYAVPEGSAVRAIGAGKVSDVRYHPRNGHTLTITHAGGKKSKYFHLRAKAQVRPGQRVAEGEIVGEVGNTGTASRGSHLHLEAWKDGVCIDPETWFASPT